MWRRTNRAGLSNGDTNFCEIYDPRTSPSTVTPLPPPPGWGNIADAPSCVLTDGTFLLGNTQGLGSQVALLDPSTLTWTFGKDDAVMNRAMSCSRPAMSSLRMSIIKGACDMIPTQRHS